MPAISCWTKWNTIFTGIIALFAVIGVLFAIITIRQQQNIWEEQLELGRSYFSIKEPGAMFVDDLIEKKLYINIGFINKGLHPASYYSAEFFIIEIDSEHIVLNDILRSANDIASGIPVYFRNFYIEDISLVPPLFIKWMLTYKDPILNEDYEQSFYLRWNAIQKNGQYDKHFVDADNNDKNRIDKIIKEYIEENQIFNIPLFKTPSSPP